MKKYILIVMVLISVLATSCVTKKITNFEECVAAGNPVMESYPRQCRTEDGQTFTEVISHVCTQEEKSAQICTMDYNPVCGDNMKTYSNGCSACASGEVDSWTLGECKIQGLTLEEAIAIAQNTECTEKGTLTDVSVHNTNTNTWWIDLDMKEEFKKELCNPACVVNEVTREAEINWRCTGALPP